MELQELIGVVTLLVAMSTASERLVEIIKKSWAFLDERRNGADAERRRQFLLNLLAVVCGTITVALVNTIEVGNGNPFGRELEARAILAWGVLTSAGSVFWNTILSYLISLKNIKKKQEIEAWERKS